MFSKKSLKEKLKKGEFIYQKGYKMAENEFNVLSIIQSIQKLKATVGALVADDDKILFEAKKNYFSNIIIYTDSEEENNINSTNKFKCFLESDYRKGI